MIVVDLTVLMPQLLPDPRSPVVLRVAARDRIWVMPLIWRVGVCDGLLVPVRGGRIDVSVARTLLLAAGMLVRDSHERITEAAVLPMADELGVTATQAVYVLTARRPGASLVTFDPQVLSACPDVAVPADTFGAS